MHQQGVRTFRALAGIPFYRKLFGLSSRGQQHVRHFARRPSLAPASQATDCEKESQIKFFQQDFPWSTKSSPADPDYQVLDLEEGARARGLKKKAAQLDKELEELEQGAKDGTFLAPLIQELPLHEQKKIAIALQKNKINEEEKSKILEERWPQIQIDLKAPPGRSVYLDHLNKALKDYLEHKESRSKRGVLHKSFLQFGFYLADIVQQIPEATWEVLFESTITAEIKGDSKWAFRRNAVFESMIASGKTPSASQKLLYMDSLSNSNRSIQAIELWEDMEKEVKEDPAALARHQVIGVSLFISRGDPRRAEELALLYLENEPPEESRMLRGVLAAWLEQEHRAATKRAWALYLRMKARLGCLITMQDYDNIIMTFLNHHRTDLALAVFKDMMLTNQDSEETSLELYEKARALMSKVQDENIGLEDLNALALTSLTTLPRKFENRFFYGSWLKKLIGMGQLDAAAQVVELMIERGVKPDPKHLNGIIGAWMRSGRDASHEKAERMAWAMVHERLDFVDKRNLRTNPASLQFVPPELKPDRVHVIPPANIETIDLLLSYYVHRNRNDQVELVEKVRVAAEITPDSFYMNHLLYHEGRQGNLYALWRKYVDAFAFIAPDLETFECLWRAQKAHLEDRFPSHPNEFPGTHVIMREMALWLLALKGKKLDDVRNEFDRDLYSNIIYCMCLTGDFEGALVTCYFLKDRLGIYPGASTAKMITSAFAGLEVGATTNRSLYWKLRREKTRPSPGFEKVFNQIGQLYEDFWNARMRILEDEGIPTNDLPDFVRNEEGLYILTLLVKHVQERNKMAFDNSTFESKIAKAASAISVPEMRVEDPIPSYFEQEQNG